VPPGPADSRHAASARTNPRVRPHR
jgi:hypothetical protein